MATPTNSTARLSPQRLKRCCLTLLIVLAGPAALAQSDASSCGSLKTGYGPFDYRTTRGEKLDVVERFHFTPEVEALIRGKSSMNIGQDLNYTLNAFPNHHRALMSMMRYGQRLNTPKPADVPRSIECYFVRALLFQPDDVVARMMYASFLATNDRAAQAQQELEQVERAAGDNPFTYYNLGLIYTDMKVYDKALSQAHKAMALGLDRTELRDRLRDAGKWREPAARDSAPASTAETPAQPSN